MEHLGTLSALAAGHGATNGVAGCRMCGLPRSHATFDRALIETRNFVVVPSKGGFLVGWLMVVPREHVLSSAALSAPVRDELNQLIERLSQHLTARIAPPTIFEHGATQPGSEFGCGVDHAHVHLVPLDPSVSLLGLAEQKLGARFNLTRPDNCRPYLSVREPNGPWRALHPTGAVPRQFFRQLIWRHHGSPGSSYDYDQEPCAELAERTLAMLVAA